MKNGHDSLRNYRNLVAKVDALCGSIEREHAERITCCKGCDSCCRHISLFWVEAAGLALALRDLPRDTVSLIREKARSASAEGACPLLEKGICLLYMARPIICRTHGLPILTSESGRRMVDFCPRNFIGVESLPGNSIIDLDLLNTSLAAVNALFVAEFFHGCPPEKERLTIAEALLLE
jgi:Fe-S-cluster containining protein